MRGPLLIAVVVALAAAGPSAGATGIDSVYARPDTSAARPSGPGLLAALNPFLVRASALSLPRESVDRQDDSPGRPQVHFIYAVPSDDQDRGLDADGILDGSIGALQTWLRSQTGGAGLRIDTYQGLPDITFVRLSQPNAAYLAGGSVFEALFTELMKSGFDDPQKLYAVFYDGTAPSDRPDAVLCGEGGTEAGVWAGAAVYLQSGCPYDLGSSLAGNAGVLEYVITHEIVHGMGFVPSCAPHYQAGGHVSDSPSDLMSAFVPQTAPILDVNHDDYYNAHVSGCPDVSGSRFLEGGGSGVLVNVVERGGTGVVTGSPGGIRCPSNCNATFDSWAAPTMQLSVEPGSHSVFVGWEGACAGSSPICSLTPSGSQTVTAIFGKAPPPPPVRLTVAVTGSGRIVSTPAGISCPTRCTKLFPYDATVRLHAIPHRGWRLVSWGSTCAGAGACSLELGEPSRVHATFRRA